MERVGDSWGVCESVTRSGVSRANVKAKKDAARHWQADAE
jgi:hypothetical protein